jgi:GH15 family glucan-1,4-alpha-glucosidase
VSMGARMGVRIADYGVIGNCRTALLVSSRGSIDWGCFPKFDSPSQFARLLDPNGGHFILSPTASFESRQEYLEDTNVLSTRYLVGRSVALATDLMTLKDPAAYREELWPDTEILRIVDAREGEIEFKLELLLRCDYGRRGMSLRRMGEWGVQASDGRKQFILQAFIAGEKITLEESELGSFASATFHLRAGERAIVSLSYSHEAPAVIPALETAVRRLDQTVHYWRGWAGRCTHVGPSRKLVQRSALALKLLNFAPSGAFIAAPTSSLPEWIGGSRNWDYRYCWLRDASFTTRALVRLGYLEEAKSFLNWLLHSTRLTWPRLQVLYSVYGESRIKETVAEKLSGYQGSKPVRFGNHASTQLQLDLYGEVIDSFYSLSEFLDPIDRETRKMVTGFGRSVSELWNRADQGIWEFRSHPRHFTHSKVMCWVAMDRLGKLQSRMGWRLPYEPNGVASEIRENIESGGFDPKLNAYTRSFGESELDASVLVMLRVGYCSADSPRYLATLKAIIRGLSRNDFVYRYRPGSDGLEEPEGAFAICNFWLAEALARAGNLGEARRWFDAVVHALPPTGLASEEIDPESGGFLGNYPQGFSHIGLINAALAIDALELGKKARASA